MNESDKRPKSRKTKMLIVFAVFIVIAIIAFLFINPLTGNPVSKLLVKNTARAYVSDTYSALDLQLERVAYNFKDGCYYAHFTSPDNVDIHFAVSADGWGKLLSDDYESHVTSGWNTAMRLDQEYRALVNTVLETDNFPYVCDIGYGELLYENFSVPVDTTDCLNMASLEIGKNYDVAELAETYGHLTIYIDSDTVTVENAAGILLQLKQLLDHADVPFFSIDFTLQYPRSEEDGARLGEAVMVLGFPYEDIHTDGMAERVQTAYEAALAYYAERDAIKGAEATEW